MMDQAGVLGAALERIRTSPRIADDFAALCACGGRFAGTPSEARAREFLATRAAEAMGTAVRRHRVAYRGWTRGPASVRAADGRSFPALGLVRTPSVPEGVTGRLVDAGRGTPEDIARAGAAVRGAIVLVRHEYMVGTGHVHRRRKYDAARAAGAAGFLIACHEPGELPVTGSSGDGGAGHIPAAGISRETGAILAASGGEVTLAFTDAAGIGDARQAGGDVRFPAVPTIDADELDARTDPGVVVHPHLIFQLQQACQIEHGMIVAEQMMHLQPRRPLRAQQRRERGKLRR